MKKSVERGGPECPEWIDQRDALAIHDRLAAIEGSACGVRDMGLLESALARPQQLFTYGKKPGIAELAAAYMVGIIRNHPFIDGNKRTGFVIGVLFLELNGYRFMASEEDAAQAVLSLADGSFGEDALAAWIQANAKRQ